MKMRGPKDGRGGLPYEQKEIPYSVVIEYWELLDF